MKTVGIIALFYLFIDEIQFTTEVVDKEIAKLQLPYMTCLMNCYEMTFVKEKITFLLKEVEEDKERVLDCNSSRLLAILLFVYQEISFHPPGQWFRRQLCTLKSWIT